MRVAGQDNGVSLISQGLAGPKLLVQITEAMQVHTLWIILAKPGVIATPHCVRRGPFQDLRHLHRLQNSNDRQLQFQGKLARTRDIRKLPIPRSYGCWQNKQRSRYRWLAPGCPYAFPCAGQGPKRELHQILCRPWRFWPTWHKPVHKGWQVRWGVFPSISYTFYFECPVGPPSGHLNW